MSPFWSRRRRRTPYDAGIDAVVVNYRTPDDLTGFVESVLASEPQHPVRLVIANVAPLAVDLAAAEDALRLATDRVSISHLPFDDNVGYAKGCNAGALGGSHDVIALFNADTRATPGVLDACREALLSRDDWGTLGPRQTDQLGRITAGGTVGTNEAPKQRGWRQPDDGRLQDIREDAVTVSGSAYFVKRSVWQELTDCPIYRSVAPEAEGAFLPTRLFFEETFCSYHVGAHGYRNVYYGPLHMIHTWHGSIEQNESPATDLFQESQAYFRRACEAHGIAHNITD